MAQGGQETEVKLSVSDVKTARTRLRAAGFRLFKRRVFEANTVYDTPRRTLREAATLLRLRQAAALATLTFKGTPIVARHKSREELELTVSDAPVMGAILERLGYLPAFRYEKYRAEYRQPDSPGIATIDETPIGVFVELEGPPEWIDGTARQMGFAEADYINISYARLYQEWCRKEGVEASDMVFGRIPRTGHE